MKLFGPPKGKETLFRYLWKYRHQFIISSIGGILYNTVIVFSPILLGRLIDASGSGTGRQVLLSAALFIGVTAFFQLSRWIKRWFMRDQFNRVACDLRQTFLERMLRRSAPELDRETVGDLMSRTVGDITLVVDTVMTTLNEGWDTWLLMISFFVAMLVADWQVTLLASVMVPVTIALAQGMRHVLYKYAMAARKAASESNSNLQRYLSAVSMLRLFGREREEAEEIGAAFDRQADYTIREMLLQQALLPIYALLAGLGIVVVIALGGRRVIDGQWTVGAFNAYLFMFIAFSGRTRVAARVFNRWHAARAAWTRIKEKMGQPGMEETVEGNSVKPFQVTCLELENVSFGFGDAPYLRNVGLTVKTGQVVGITGPVGSGKTLLAQVLTGLYPYGGSIRVDGQELSELSDATRSRLVAYAGHEQHLFSMSLQQNITLSDPEDGELDPVRLERALRAAALLSDLPRFAQGLETMVGEKGVLLSGGQRQRVALARAFYSQAPLLVLDDPFSAVDIATEEAIVNHLREDFPDRIILLFSHRLTAFPRMDHVLVLRQGEIAQAGSHESLLKSPGLYRDIYLAQRFLEEGAHETA